MFSYQIPGVELRPIFLDFYNKYNFMKKLDHQKLIDLIFNFFSPYWLFEFTPKLGPQPF